MSDTVIRWAAFGLRVKFTVNACPAGTLALSAGVVMVGAAISLMLKNPPPVYKLDEG